MAGYGKKPTKRAIEFSFKNKALKNHKKTGHPLDRPAGVAHADCA